MITRNLLALCIALSAISIACNKNDVKKENVDPANSISNEWETVSTWQAKTMTDYSVYTSSQQDSLITDNIANNGLVLLYLKQGTEVMALPFQQTVDNGTIDWYYQIETGTITINAETHGSAAFTKNQSFNSLIFSPSQLKDLELKGKTKADLMQLSFSDAKKLLN